MDEDLFKWGLENREKVTGAMPQALECFRSARKVLDEQSML